MLYKIKTYLLAALFIAGWWGLAFEQKPRAVKTLKTASLIIDKDAITAGRNLLPALSSLSRNTLHQALAGDFTLMAQLIAEWDIDAQLLQEAGYAVQRLSHKDFLQSQLLYRIEKLAKREKIQHCQFLPQTYTAASFLLALVRPEEIAALPRHLRDQTQLYPRKLTDKIQLNIDRYHSEKLFQAKPRIALVANYSHPATIQTIENQGIEIYTMSDLATLSDIKEEIMQVGYLVDRSLEAELLKIFIDASMAALDNQMTTVNHHHSPKILFLNYHRHFTLPTAKTVTRHLLARLKNLDMSLQYAFDDKEAQKWAIPIDKEHILNLNPDCLIIATSNPAALEEEMRSDPAFKTVPAICNNHLFFVDETVQNSPSQYIVLAYFDLIQALVKLP